MDEQGFKNNLLRMLGEVTGVDTRLRVSVLLFILERNNMFFVKLLWNILDFF